MVPNNWHLKDRSSSWTTQSTTWTSACFTCLTSQHHWEKALLKTFTKSLTKSLGYPYHQCRVAVNNSYFTLMHTNRPLHPLVSTHTVHILCLLIWWKQLILCNCFPILVPDTCHVCGISHDTTHISSTTATAQCFWKGRNVFCPATFGPGALHSRLNFS